MITYSVVVHIVVPEPAPGAATDADGLAHACAVNLDAGTPDWCHVVHESLARVVTFEEPAEIDDIPVRRDGTTDWPVFARKLRELRDR